MLGFHGCDEHTRNMLVHDPDSMKKSEEPYDWLGHGFYIWENNFERALSWAKDIILVAFYLCYLICKMLLFK